MNERRSLAVVGGAVVLVAAGVLFLRKGPAAPAPPAAKAARVERAADPPAGTAEAEAAAHAHAEARRARDAMRANIMAALRRRQPPPAVVPARAPAPKASAAPAAEEEPPHGHYEPSYIQENFRADMFPLIKQCYDSALKRSPALGGRLLIKFAIVGDPQVGGIVEEAAFADESNLKDEEMETCVRESVMTLTFDKPPSGGGKVMVTYPILFSPGDEPPEEKPAARGDGGAP